MVDGYEQLGPWARFRARRLCRRLGLGLLVTSHRPVGLPPLANTGVSLETALWVVDYLTARGPAVVGRADVADRLAARGGDLREALFDLYALHESRAAAPVDRR